MRKDYLVNNRIRSEQVRVILGTGENLGVLKTQDALEKARSLELDLVVIAESANPPVAKILDFKKFLYSERKKASDSRSRQSEMKELRLTPQIGVGDMEQRAQRVKEFLDQGDTVKVSLAMKGRQAMFPQVAMDKMKTFDTMVSEFAKSEGEIKRNGNVFSLMYVKKS